MVLFAIKSRLLILLVLLVSLPIHQFMFVVRPFVKEPMSVNVPNHNFWPFIPVVSPIVENKTYYDLPSHNFWPFIPIVPPKQTNVLQTTPGNPTSTIPWIDDGKVYDYSEVLQKSILFYEAQRSGRLPSTNRIAWRGDSGLQDQGIFGEDLTGGWYDAGDYVKFGLPMAGATTLLVWGLIEFRDGYEIAGLLDDAYDCVLWPLQYFMKAHPTKFEFYAQVGDPNVDHSYWGRPEDMQMYRPGYRLSPERPGSEVVAETAAALAAGSIAFRTRDPLLSRQMLKHAEELFEFAVTYQGKYSDVVDNVSEFYPSGGYDDEICWAAAWLYRATGMSKYLVAAENYYRAGGAWALSWEEKAPAASVLLYTLTKHQKFKDDVLATLEDWMPGGTVPYTPKGLAYRAEWGSLRYTANMAMIALISANAGLKPNKYRLWAKKQIHYMLGDSGRSFVIGYGVNPPARPHHASSSCSPPPWTCTWADYFKPGPNTHTLYGALVGGPDQYDNFVDDRTDYVKNEVTCDYNAGFQSAVAVSKKKCSGYSSDMLIALLLLIAVSSALSADVHTTFTITKQWDENFKGNFCFKLTFDMIGYEIFINFDHGVKGLREFEGNWIGKHPDCATKYTMVNKESRGQHKAGEELCIKFLGQVCGAGKPTATAVLKDLMVDNQKAPTVPHLSGAQSTKYNYAEVLEKSIMFYEAQRSGKLPANNRIPWRGDSALGDKGNSGEDLTGGWYDAGDNVKFNFPMAWSTTVLAWGLIQWQDAYEKSGQLNYMYDSIKWPLDYLMKCHTSANELYVQVGDGHTDHSSWNSPERMTGDRPAFSITASHGGADVGMETAAALAAGSIAFKTKDPSYSHKLLTQAESIYKFAQKTHDRYSVSVHAASSFYKSSNVSDELGWGAVWLYKATGDKAYLAEAEKHHDKGAAWGFSWDEKTAGVNMLLFETTKKDIYKSDVVATMKAWMPGGHVPYTPKCLAYRLQWGPLRYSANTALIALMAADHGINPEPYRKWAMSQINYALGDAGRSYVVGFGKNPPVKPHHRSSSCPLMPAPCGWDAQLNPGPNPHTLYGALVGGPSKSDDYADDRKDYTKNEVACDYNAGFQSAVAGLIHLSLKHSLPTEYKSICSHSK